MILGSLGPFEHRPIPMEKVGEAKGHRLFNARSTVLLHPVGFHCESIDYHARNLIDEALRN